MVVEAFIHHLAGAGMIDLAVLRDVSEDGFVTRFRIQKYAYLADKCGLDHGHRYSMYRHGPYSPTLARLYYDMDATKEDSAPLPRSFDLERFATITKGRDNKWLEIATTLLDQERPGRTEQELLEHVEVIKSWVGPQYIKGILEDLKGYGLYPS